MWRWPFGERGVIDIVAWHPASRSLLIIELKTALVDPQDLVAVMDRRARLGRRIGQDLGWQPATVSAWVVVLGSRTNRRRHGRHVGLLRAAFPTDGRGVRARLRASVGSLRALSIWSDVGSGSVRTGVGQDRRVRRLRQWGGSA